MDKPGPPLECMRGRMRIPIFSGKGVFLAVVSGRFPEGPEKGVIGGYILFPK